MLTRRELIHEVMSDMNDDLCRSIYAAILNHDIPEVGRLINAWAQESVIEHQGEEVFDEENKSRIKEDINDSTFERERAEEYNRGNRSKI